MMSAFPQAASAEVRLVGSPEAVEVEVNEATVEELLTALRETYDVQYRSSVALNRSISGSYSGPLRQVLARVLRGYDFFVDGSEGRLRVAVVSSAENPSAPPDLNNLNLAAPRPPIGPNRARVPPNGGPRAWNGGPGNPAQRRSPPPLPQNPRRQ
jgi:hypothetical protein